MDEQHYISQRDIYYPAVLAEIKKSKNQVQPILEAFTNALEAIKMLSEPFDNGKVLIKFYYNKLLDESLNLTQIEIEDSGIGFNEENFERFKRYKDIRKGFNNRGSGRLQYIHFFKECCFESSYQGINGFEQISFAMSKQKTFLDKDAIILFKGIKKSENQFTGTKLTFKYFWDDEAYKYYNKLSLMELRQLLVSHYMLYFCLTREKMPEIRLERYINNILDDDNTVRITSNDIPEIDKEINLNLNYYNVSETGKSLIKLDKTETFNIRSFKINQKQLDKNEIKLTSKSEVIDNIKFEIPFLSATDCVDKSRFLFLISSNYIDERDGDNRGEVKIPTEESFINETNLFQSEEILLDDIKEKVSQSIVSMYDEISKKADDQNKNIDKLKDMFLINEETLKAVKFSVNDTEEKILEKIYEADAKISAKKDAELKKMIDSIDGIDPTSETYLDNLDKVILEMTERIPLQNRTALTKYIARRKLVLDLYEKALNKQLQIQQSTKRNIDEKIFHNIIFHQNSTDSLNSDLWILNEDFIYFNGVSESKLGEIKIGDKLLFKEELNEEEKKHRLVLGEDRYAKRPDVLLFPDEGKCIIVEFKNPDKNVAEHLNQISRYASLIRNFTQEEFKIDTFYGYLVGENLDYEDVRDYDPDFKYSSHFKYLFRASKAVAGKFNRPDGSIYMEIIKFSTLLERSQLRNKIFIEKLMKPIEEDVF